jgi:hypothetical protein
MSERCSKCGKAITSYLPPHPKDYEGQYVSRKDGIAQHEDCKFIAWNRSPGPLFDKPPGAVARDAAIERVLENAGESFSVRVLQIVSQIPLGTLCTGESIRRRCIQQGVLPHHHNAWGGVMAGLSRSPLLEQTGQWVQMQEVRSHARRTPEYVRVAQ